MSLVTWGGKLLLSPNGKLTLGPAADVCCCVGDGVDCAIIPDPLYIDMDNETDCSSCFGTTETLTLNEQLTCNPTVSRCWFGQGTIGCGQYMTVLFVCYDDGTIAVSITCGGVTSAETPMTVASTSPWQTQAAVVPLPGSGCCGGSANAEISIVIRE